LTHLIIVWDSGGNYNHIYAYAGWEQGQNY